MPLDAVTLASEYKRQFAWRRWSEVMDRLPPLGGKTVLDLGCGIGDQAAQLAERGAHILGLDTNTELLVAARSIPNAEFRNGDIKTLDALGLFDGIWCSFAAAYVPDLGPTLARWRKHLAPRGWIALTEIDDLFGHEPLLPNTTSLLLAYAQDALVANRYDFHMGRKLATHLERAGFSVTDMWTLPDRELSFDGSADADVLAAWKSRFDRMNGLRAFCGEAFDLVRDDFLAALSRPDHRSSAKVYVCIAML
jgi:2-polyprenyl-3-methyl-5-hydroxy-6-metoxy-1,4-benzoquinol methylase